MRIRYTIISIIILLTAIAAQAQIKIGGNVYGGGNAGKLSGSTKVVVRAGDVKGGVFGGARQADVGGSAFVHIDGPKMSGDITINTVYGGNDIAGTVGTSTTLPHSSLGTDANHNVNDYNAFVLTQPERTETGSGNSATTTQPFSIFIGQLYGGGNGDYPQTDKAEGKYDVTVKETQWDATANEGAGAFVEKDVTLEDVDKPELSKTFVDLHGGTFGYVFGGGNAVTVKEAVDICINNTSTVTTEANGLKLTYADANQTNGVTKPEDITSANLGDNPHDLRLLDMGINLSTYVPGYNFLRVFGGNNKAAMHIRPNWHLQDGSIVNLYSGGNEGRMTSSDGLLLEIPTGSEIVVENVFGGCRKADVFPSKDVAGTILVDTIQTIQPYKFPDGLAARVLVRGGDVNNVYGGNDISGKVYFGNAVGVYKSIRGDVYGGGNGSYAYTDNVDLKDDLIWGDFYYNPGTSSVDALNAHRPNAEQVSVRVVGTSATEPTIIGGGVYVGGNCATLKPKAGMVNPRAELKIGSYAIADKVFLGNNGEKMIDPTILERYAGTVTNAQGTSGIDFSSLDLTDVTTAGVMAKYMDGVTMEMKPKVGFDSEIQGDPDTYKDYTSYFGSFYCGGNVGSVRYNGVDTIDFKHKVVIFSKLVGGSNNAYVNETFDANNKKLNAAYEGGLLGDPETDTGNKLILNLSGLKVRPMRFRLEGTDPAATAQTPYPKQLAWNTVGANGNPTAAVTSGLPTGGISTTDDMNRRFIDGNIYGGCCESGIVNGNVVINLDGTIIERDSLFDKVEEDNNGEVVYYNNETYKITERRTGVILGQQGMDVLGKALNVFGGGKGKGTQIWGSTTINLKKGYTFQIFGGSEQGVIGKPDDGEGEAYTFNGKTYKYNPKYSCYVNLCGEYEGVTKTSESSHVDMAECEFIYGGAFEGPIAGNAVINLGKGRIFNSFAGSCNADILGHTETYIGRTIKDDYLNVMGYLGSTKENGVIRLEKESYYNAGFPWVRDIVYGGNDLGGEIKGEVSFKHRVRTEVLDKVHKYNAQSNPNPDVLKASAYVEYLQGRADAIFGGCYGTYNYKDAKFVGKYTDAQGEPLTDANDKPIFTKPRMNSAFVNFRPTYFNQNDSIKKVYGAGQGAEQSIDPTRDGDKQQNRSYVLVDIPSDMHYYEPTVFFGAGSFNGLGMKYTQAETQPTEGTFDLDKCSAIIDLARGKVGNVYGGGFNESIVRRTVINVPEGSTINVKNIFGGGFGRDIDIPCDVYEAQVNYHSEDATVRNNIYGGNNNADRTFYSQINITKPVYNGAVGSDGTRYNATVYGAGCGVDTWAQYTEVNLLPGACINEVYGGGENGRVFNKESLDKWALEDQDLDLSMHSSYTENGLDNILVHEAALGGKYNTNVHIYRGATVVNYAYGGGLGDSTIPHSGDVYGTTYIDLLGGTVKKDIYAAGTTGSVQDGFRAGTFTAGTTAYIAGGSCRNVYGGGWKGSVGQHRKIQTIEGQVEVLDEDADIHDPATHDIAGESRVVIGIRKDQKAANLLAAIKKVAGENATAADYGFYAGLPTIQRNAYGGGEGGAVYGKTNLTLNNGYIGYEYNTTTGTYNEKVDDETYFDDETGTDGTGRLRDCGNIFGGGYDARSSVDETNVVMYSGEVRGSLHGGGEIATIGRGSTRETGSANSERTFEAIYKEGKTLITMYNGHVHRNVFGGGKGYNLLGYGSNSNLYTDGYTFGQTEVRIHGGEVGTEQGVKEKGYGNVFGGGDLGYVYSKGFNSTKTLADKGNGITTGSPSHYYYYGADGHLTEDCKVVVSPYLQIKEGGTSVPFGGKTYGEFEYVPTDYLNTLPKNKDDSRWTNLITEDIEIVNDETIKNERGVLIRNAVFGGGNVASNSDTHYANATTVFGNTTATLYDVYHRDFITVGTEHTGGLYGGGNLSMVDGYRELNITNYGTDYYNLQTRVTLAEYHNKLSNRERAYFKLEYECQEANSGKQPGEKISAEDYDKLDSQYQNETYWKQYGFCSIYAGRLLNTIQRADFCGVFGSRMVLQGSKDRVADVGENIDYTINRVGEVSLNKQTTQAGDTGKDAVHGNYFGIYSLVNHLGNLTSDMRFLSNYVDENEVEHTDKTFYSYKEPIPTGPWRNRGTCHNQVALASGVFLELTTENSTADHKDYGYITGIVELDLINVKKDIEGGGFVYAKNEHRLPMFYANMDDVILSEYNSTKAGVREAAKTYKRYRYSADAKPANAANWPSSGGIVAETGKEYTYKEIQTSGNFIHAKKRIVDDCYPTNNAYVHGQDPYSEAHYWYVKGSVYVYDQVVSAYTGSATAYSKEVLLPLTITAASNGKLKLLNVKPNRYAYYYEAGQKIGTGANAEEKKVWVNRQTNSYELNDVITWWDWQNLPENEQDLFVEETYVNTVACQVNGQKYAIGEYVMLPPSNDQDKTSFIDSNTITDFDGNAIEDNDGNELTGINLFNNVFRTSNNLGHETGYVLTFDMNTPGIWDDYHTVTTGTNKISEAAYQTLLNNAANDAARQTIINTYTEGPTFRPIETAILGRHNYTEGQIITKGEFDLIDGTDTDSHKQRFKEAYVAKTTVSYTVTLPDPDYPEDPDKETTTTKTINPGTAISKVEWELLSSTNQAAFAPALVCTNTVKLATDIYLHYGELKTAEEIDELKLTYSTLADDIDAALSNAYICTKTGEAGGRKYDKNTNYSAIQSWCALSETDRNNFNFNYDALDLFVDPDYSVETTNGKTTAEAYDGLPTPVDESKQLYSKEVGVEYQAVFKATTEKPNYPYSGGTLTDGQSIPNTVFEAEVPNYKQYYTKVNTTTDVDANTGKFYIANTNFIYDGEPYGLGQVVNNDVYLHNSGKVTAVTPTLSGVCYYCNQAHSEGTTSVAVGQCIDQSTYTGLRDDQQYFVIQGQEPTEVTTLYVNRESDIKDVTKEKIITVVYQYTYYEEDDNHDIKLTNELHVVNVHLQLESGAPTIGPLEIPPTVLPGTAVGMKAPDVTPGIYDPITNGWELFANSDDADHHRNGVPFTNNSTPVYWYQNKDYYIAFYSQTYLGKTYSNYVPLSVANYHDLADIMENHKDNHLYIDRADVDRPCKIYINDYSALEDNDPRKGKNGLDELKDLFDLSIGTAVDGHTPLEGTHIKGCNNLEIILRSDVDRTKPTEATEWTAWAPLGDDTNCFGGNVHGDGHTVSGLETSLFGKLCGNVYNLGVTGSFTTAGVADSGDGFVENCWVKTSATALPDGASKVNAVFGNPSDPQNPNCIQVVNCYYSDKNAALYNDNSTARKMADKAFYNGEVAYDLNGFYLGKRYYDGSGLGAGTGNQSYDFITANADGTLPRNATSNMATAGTAYYPAALMYYTPQGTLQKPKLGYVEQRFYDGDFRYAGGTLPGEFNDRRQENEVTDSDDKTVTDITWIPIWPDDYLFFGQRLTYGHVSDWEYQDHPSSINRSSQRVLTSEEGNRVYRAPAYYRSGKMEVAHFNPYAVFAQTKKDDASVIAYKGMTAIDFTGGNGDVSGATTDYKNGWVTAAPYNNIEGGAFCPPLLDDDGLTEFQNIDLTRNLLVYTTAGTTTDGIMKTKLQVPDEYYVESSASTHPGYHTVNPWDSPADKIRGHWVQLTTDDGYVAPNDHLLVDRNDFFCPLEYQFDSSYRMWYQRDPDNYVGKLTDSSGNYRSNTGWEGISIPFEAEIVTTNQKGEITHFYNNSWESKNDTKTKIGHEYWLRWFDKIANTDGDKVTANMTYPNGGTEPKEYQNHFLWDYYYSRNYRDDLNSDDYQEGDASHKYYSTDRDYENYPRLTKGTPYIIGFPGKRYYEFDLSGEFEALTTSQANPPTKIGKQTITFASKPGITINLSNTEMDGTQDTKESKKYTFLPNYLNMEFASGSNTYTLNAEGSSYDKVPDTGSATTHVDAFRPYFTVTPSSSNPSRPMTRSIVFSNERSEMKGVEERDNPKEVGGSLKINSKRHLIIVESALTYTVNVTIVNTAGIIVNKFTINPGETIETRVNNAGVYIVQPSEVRFTKKLSVR